MTLDELDRKAREAENGGYELCVEVTASIARALIEVAKAAKEFAECDSLDVQMQLKSALAALDKELEG